MKKFVYTILSSLAFLFCFSCGDDDIAVFDKSADERVAEAIASLKAELVAPSNGWRLKYKPVSDAGSYYVLMVFNEDNTVKIQTDFGASEGKFLEQTIPYRIDNSLGLELIFETYSFFSFLFEQDQASFGAEYEFNYANKTPDGELVFTSKTDIVGAPTTILFEQAVPSDIELLGVKVGSDLSQLTDDLPKFTSSLSCTYEGKDLILYISLDDFKRTISIGSASLKSNIFSVQQIDFFTGYIVQGNAIVFETPFAGNILGTQISIESISFSTLSDGTINVCNDPININSYSGVTSANDKVQFQTSLIDAGGSTFVQSDVYFSPLFFIFENGVSRADSIAKDISGANQMQLYYNAQLRDGTRLFGMGFVIQNPDGSSTLAVREFTPVVEGNKILFNFKPGFRLFGTTETQANLENINKYLDALTAGGTTYAFKIFEGRYELYNPCTKWSFVFQGATD